MVNHPTPPLGASAEGVGWGWYSSVYTNLLIWLRKKNTRHNNLFLVLIFYWALLPPKWWYCIPHVINPGWTASHGTLPPGKFFFGWLLCSPSSSLGGHLRPICINLLLIFRHSNFCPKWWTTSPHALQPPCNTYSTFTLSQLSIPGWLLCVIVKFLPLKAKEHPSLIFDKCCFAPIKQANQPWCHRTRPRLLRMGQ